MFVVLPARVKTHSLITTQTKYSTLYSNTIRKVYTTQGLVCMGLDHSQNEREDRPECCLNRRYLSTGSGATGRQLFAGSFENRLALLITLILNEQLICYNLDYAAFMYWHHLLSVIKHFQRLTSLCA
jgi:hypothetical protein